MTPDDVTRYLTATFPDVEVHDEQGDFFYFVGAERMFPFATLVTKDDAYDQSANLDREGVFRFNVGVDQATYQRLVGDQAGTAIDYAALDRVMPHPVYATHLWVGVLNPSEATFEGLKPILAAAHQAKVDRRK